MLSAIVLTLIRGCSEAAADVQDVKDRSLEGFPFAEHAAQRKLVSCTTADVKSAHRVSLDRSVLKQLVRALCPCDLRRARPYVLQLQLRNR